MAFDVVSVEGIPLSFALRESADRYCEVKGIDKAFVVERDTSPETSSAKLQMQLQVDGLANLIYAQFVATPGLLKEYQTAEDEAKAWLLDTNQPAPKSITSWAVPKGWTNEQAAADIMAASVRLNGLMAAIRKARLAGKEAIASATTLAGAQTAMLASLVELKKIAGI
jgi:hypothetical protein